MPPQLRLYFWKRKASLRTDRTFTCSLSLISAGYALKLSVCVLSTSPTDKSVDLRIKHRVHDGASN